MQLWFKNEELSDALGNERNITIAKIGRSFKCTKKWSREFSKKIISYDISKISIKR